MPNDYFRFKQFTLHQDRCAMKVGTDGTLLGAWAEGGARILDIGTGTGLIALMMAQRFSKARVTAIEIDQEACLQARENVANSPFFDRVEVLDCSLQQFVNDYSLLSDIQENMQNFGFDSIVCNPPFFVNSLQAPDEQRSTARHATQLTYAQLFDGVSRLLAPEGVFSAIVPFDYQEAFTTEAILHGMHPWRVCAVKTTPRKQPRRYLLAFRRQQAPAVEQTIGVIEESPNVRSAWYRQLTEDFYL